MADLVNSLPWDQRFRQRRDPTFFYWRYRNPRSAYRFFFHGSEKLKGYLILEAARRRTSMEARLVDWEATNDQVAEELLSAAVDTAGLKHLSTWTLTLPDSRIRLLEAAGFKTVNDGEGRVQSESPSVLIKALQDEDLAGEWVLNNRQVEREANWDFRPVYSDAG
jgi:hypothetical protein